MVVQPHGQQPFPNTSTGIAHSAHPGLMHEWVHAMAGLLRAVARALRGPVMFLTEAAVVLSIGGLAIAALAYVWSHL